MIKSIEMKSCTPYDEKGAKLENCKNINLIFGANGSGKTTISEYLRTLDNPDDRYKECLVDWESTSKLPIYVYNRNFRQNNFNSGDGIPGVFTLGQDNIEKQNRIKDLNKKIEDKEKEIYKNQNNIEERMEERKKTML